MSFLIRQALPSFVPSQPLPPFVAYCFYQPFCAPIVSAAFKQSCVGIDLADKSVEVAVFIWVCVSLADGINGTSVGFIVQMDSVFLDMGTEKFKAVLIRLVVEFLVVDADILYGKSLPQRGNE